MLGLPQLLQPLYQVGHWLKMTGGFLPIIFSNLLFSPTVAASNNLYRPFIEVGGAKYFHQSSSAAGIYDLFIPLLQTEDQLFFTDLRIFDRSGRQCEGNAHLGYRKLYPASQQMFGIYGSIDRKKTKRDNYFNQITVGFEYWQGRFFVGGNFYQPIGINKRPISPYEELSNIRDFPNLEVKTQLDRKQKAEKTLGGGDLELGWTITDSLIGYAGGYYFAGHDVNTVAGPRVRLAYDYTKLNGRIWGILDGVSIEGGIQYDQPRRTSGYIGIKFKIGLTELDRTSNVQGFARHMVELVRRDQDIVHLDTITPEVIGTDLISVKKITSQDLINEFGPIDEHNLLKLYVQLTNAVVNNLSYSKDEEKICEKVLCYFNLLLEAGIKSSKYIANTALDYVNKISNKETRLTAEPLFTMFVDIEDKSVSQIHREVAVIDHFQKLDSAGATYQEMKKIQLNKLINYHPDRNPRQRKELFYTYNTEKIRNIIDNKQAQENVAASQTSKIPPTSLTIPKLLSSEPINNDIALILYTPLKKNSLDGNYKLDATTTRDLETYGLYKDKRKVEIASTQKSITQPAYPTFEEIDTVFKIANSYLEANHTPKFSKEIGSNQIFPDYRQFGAKLLRPVSNLFFHIIDYGSKELLIDKFGYESGQASYDGVRYVCKNLKSLSNSLLSNNFTSILNSINTTKIATDQAVLAINVFGGGQCLKNILTPIVVHFVPTLSNFMTNTNKLWWGGIDTVFPVVGKSLSIVASKLIDKYYYGKTVAIVTIQDIAQLINTYSFYVASNNMKLHTNELTAVGKFTLAIGSETVALAVKIPLDWLDYSWGYPSGKSNDQQNQAWQKFIEDLYTLPVMVGSSYALFYFFIKPR